MRNRIRQTPFLAVLFLAPAFAAGHSAPSGPARQDQGPGGFAVTREPVSPSGVRATADLPTSQHHRNAAGSDGFGLCVYTSAWHNALWQSVTDVYDFRDWMRKRPGGSYPEKFDATLAAFCRERGIPIPPYVQHTGGDEEFLELALKTGRMVGITYCGADGPGRYGSEVVAHMVNLVHLDAQQACILDNNFPGTFLWMSRTALLCRWRGVREDGRPCTIGRQAVGGGWAIAFLQGPPPPYPVAVSYQREADNPQLAPEPRETYTLKQCTGTGCRFVTIPVPCPVDRLPAPVRDPLPDEPRPGPDYVWKDVPGLGPRWIQGGDRYDWGRKADGSWSWVLRTGQVTGLGVRSTPELVSADPFPGGVLAEKLAAEKRWWLTGERCEKADVVAALSLTDDSARWHLTAVGEPNFLRKFTDDLAALPAEARAKLHVQRYSPDAWQVAQFKLGPGLTLRRPAVGRVGADVGTVPVADYSPASLAGLLALPGGPTAQPTPAPSPKPKAPEPTPPDALPIPVPTPAPSSGLSGLLALVAAAVAVVLGLFRRRM